MIRYYKLFDILNRMGKKKSDLRVILSPKTIAKLSKGEYISGEAIEKICKFLGCQPGDIMEYIEEGIETKTGKKVEIADHTLTSQEPFEPDNDVNVYPSDEDYPYKPEYKNRLN